MHRQGHKTKTALGGATCTGSGTAQQGQCIPPTIPQEGSQLSTPPTSQIGPAIPPQMAGQPQQTINTHAAGPSSTQSTLPLPGADTNPAQPPQATHTHSWQRVEAQLMEIRRLASNATQEPIARAADNALIDLLVDSHEPRRRGMPATTTQTQPEPQHHHT